MKKIQCSNQVMFATFLLLFNLLACNLFSQSITITSLSQPQIIESGQGGVTFGNRLIPGDIVSIDVSFVVNVSSSNAAGIGLYLSSNDLYDTNDFELVHRNIGLGETGWGNMTFEFEVPNFGCEGPYLIVYSDADNPNEPGLLNQMAREVTVASSDLELKNVWVSERYVRFGFPERPDLGGYPMRVGGWASNENGCADASNVSINIFLRSTTLNGVVYRVANTGFSKIESGQKKYFRKNIIVSSSIPDGSYEMCFNSESRERDLDYSNNLTCKSFEFYPRTPDGILGGGNSNHGTRRLNTNSNTDVTIFPNPAKEEANISYQPSSKPVKLLLHNSNGQILIETIIRPNEQVGLHSIDLSNYNKGLYNITIIREDEPSTFRIIKQ